MDEDEELQRILELSRLEEEARVKQRAKTISDEDADDERRYEKELAMALAMSLAEPDTTISTPDIVETPPPDPSEAGPASQFLAERKKLEEERLARKRARPGYVGEISLPESDSAPAAKRRNIGSVASGSGSSQEKPGSLLSDSSSSLFWQGEIRQTANRHAVPGKDTKPIFRLSELLGTNLQNIKLIVLSSFCNEVPWLANILPRRAPVILINQPRPDGKASVVHPMHPDLPTWTMVTPFLRGGFGCMHMKFMLVFYPTRLRIIIPTANFIAYDWRDIENTVWTQDIPLRAPTPEAVEPPAVDDFPSRLQYALRKLNFAPALAAHLAADHPDLPLSDIKDLRRRWDWSAVKVQLVISVPGKFEGRREMGMSGHPALQRSLRELDALCPEGKELQIECQGSSIGSYSSPWLNEFHFSVAGKSLQSWFSFKEGHRRGGMSHPADIKILFPSLKTVDASVMGRPGGGSMFCREKQWSAKTFPRQLFYDSKSKRGGILMHSKMILGLFINKPDRLATGLSKDTVVADAGTEGVGGWCYIGSHNLSVAHFVRQDNILINMLVLCLLKALRRPGGTSVEQPLSRYLMLQTLKWVFASHCRQLTQMLVDLISLVGNDRRGNIKLMLMNHGCKTSIRSRGRRGACDKTAAPLFGYDQYGCDVVVAQSFDIHRFYITELKSWLPKRDGVHLDRT
ncbi:hypothetical protein FRB94_009383 [Tulasnella sp. JGI-2019a]|nr:hypothetical protein FRB94_009383 [Tulasnella sp. JGI-2019a]